MVKMGASTTYNYKGGLFDDSYFHWNGWQFKNFIIKKYNLEWVKNAKIMIFGDFIRLSSGSNYLIIRRFVTKARLTINFEKKELFLLKKIGEKIVAYSKKYPIFEGDKCIQYLQEYVPLHLPQIQCGLKDILQSEILPNLENVNIIDIGSGP
ncbi:MAG: hypothetical protein ACNA7I_00350, partial [Candidatus Methanoperedens sp.]